MGRTKFNFSTIKFFRIVAECVNSGGEMASIFVTGVAGFLGSHIAEALQNDGHEVWGIDNLIGGESDNVPDGVRWQAIDCNQHELVRKVMAGAEIVFHCAATAYEGLSVFSPHIVTQNIVGASVSVFSAAIANKVKRIVHCSSMARYGAIATPYTEDMECKPQDPYGIGKLCSEQILRNLCETHGVEYVIAVPHNIIGPRQKYDDPYRNVAAIMINRALQGKSLYIYGDGEQKRCFSYIDDCLSCLKAMAFHDGLNGEVINIGPDESPISIHTLAILVRDVCRKHVNIMYVPGRPREVRTAWCSSDKARRMLGYQTKTSLSAGLFAMKDYIEQRGPKPFQYHLPLEIVSEKTPKTWTDRLF